MGKELKRSQRTGIIIAGIIAIVFISLVSVKYRLTMRKLDIEEKRLELSFKK